MLSILCWHTQICVWHEHTIFSPKFSFLFWPLCRNHALLFIFIMIVSVSTFFYVLPTKTVVFALLECFFYVEKFYVSVIYTVVCARTLHIFSWMVFLLFARLEMVEVNMKLEQKNGKRNSIKWKGKKQSERERGRTLKCGDVRQ